MAARIAVTGASGFLGAATVRRLASEGHDVLAWMRPGSDAWRLTGCDGRRAQVWRHELDAVRRPEARTGIIDALRAFRPEVIVHCAWTGVRGASRHDAAQLLNVPVAVDLLRLAADAGVRRFVGIGSQAEYGPRDDVICEDTPAAPTTYYGAAKLAAAQLCLAEGRRRGLSVAWGRVFSVYGPGQREGALIPDLARALRTGSEYPLGRCEARWDFLFEEDAGAAVAALAASGGANGIFNIASGQAVALRDVVCKVAALAAPCAAPAIGARPESDHDLPRLEADARRIRHATGWRPVTDLDVGLAQTVLAAT